MSLWHKQMTTLTRKAALKRYDDLWWNLCYRITLTLLVLQQQEPDDGMINPTFPYRSLPSPPASAVNTILQDLITDTQAHP